MIIKVVKAWTVGLMILIVVNCVWLISLETGYFSEPLVLLLWLSPSLSAFAVSYLSPRMKIVFGVSMALPAAFLVAVLNSVLESFGNAVDFSGFRGSLILFVITLVYSIIGSTIGSLAGYFLSRRYRINDGKQKNKR